MIVIVEINQPNRVPIIIEMSAGTIARDVSDTICYAANNDLPFALLETASGTLIIGRMALQNATILIRTRHQPQED